MSTAFAVWCFVWGSVALGILGYYGALLALSTLKSLLSPGRYWGYPVLWRYPYVWFSIGNARYFRCASTHDRRVALRQRRALLFRGKPYVFTRNEPGFPIRLRLSTLLRGPRWSGS